MNKKKTLWIKGAWYAASIVFALILALYYVAPVDAWNTGAVYGLDKGQSDPGNPNTWDWKNANVKGYNEGHVIPAFYVIDKDDNNAPDGTYLTKINYDYKLTQTHDGKVIFGIDYLTTYPGNKNNSDTTSDEYKYWMALPADARNATVTDTIAIPELAPNTGNNGFFNLYNGNFVGGTSISQLPEVGQVTQRQVVVNITHQGYLAPTQQYVATQWDKDGNPKKYDWVDVPGTGHEGTNTYLTFGAHLAKSKYEWSWDANKETWNKVYSVNGSSQWPGSSLHMDSKDSRVEGSQDMSINNGLEFPGDPKPPDPTYKQPYAEDDYYTTNQDDPILISEFDGTIVKVILSNDGDTNSPELPLTLTTVTSFLTTLGGTVTTYPDGTFYYVPPAGLSGVTDTFKYVITTAKGSAWATVHIYINPIETQPDDGPPGGPPPQEMVPGNPTALENAGQLAEEGCGNFLIVDQYGQLNRYPCKDNGALCVTMEILSPDGQALFVAEAGTLVLSADGTPAYLKEGPQLIAAVKGMKPPKDMKVLSVYDFTPAGLTFDPPATVAIKYDPAKVPGNSSVTVAFLNENGQISEMETAGYVAEDISLPYTIIGLVPSIDNIIVLAAPLKQ